MKTDRREFLKGVAAFLASARAAGAEASGGTPYGQLNTGPGNDGYTPESKKVTGHQVPYQETVQGFTPALHGVTSEDGFAYIPSNDSGEVLEVDLQNPDNRNRYQTGRDPVSPLVRPSENELWIADLSSVKIFDRNNQQKIAEIPSPSAELTQQNGTIIRNGGTSIDVLDPENYEIAKEISNDGVGDNSLVLYDDGNKFGEIDGNGMLRLYDLVNDEQIAYREGGTPGLSYDPDTGTFFAGLTGEELAAFDEQGNLKDKANLDESYGGRSSPPVIDDEGNVYYQDAVGGVYSFQFDGGFERNWKSEPSNGGAATMLAFADIVYAIATGGVSILDKETGDELETVTRSDEFFGGSIGPASKGRVPIMLGGRFLAYEPVLEEPTPEPSLELLSEPQEIPLSEEGSYSLELTDTGDARYEDTVEVVFSTPAETFTGSQTVALDPGETLSLTVRVTALEDSGAFSEEYLNDEWLFEVPTGTGAVNVEFNMTGGPSVSSTYSAVEKLFNEPLIEEFDSPPEKGTLSEDGLYSDLDGDGDSKEVGPTVDVFGDLIRGNDLNLTSQQAAKLDWSAESPENEVTVGDMVSLFGKKIRAG